MLLLHFGGFMDENKKKDDIGTIRRFDLVTSIVFIAAAIWFLFQCYALFMNPFGKTEVTEKELAKIFERWFESPALFPALVGILLLVAGIALLIIALKSGARFDFITKENIKKLKDNNEFMTFCTVVGSLAVYLYALIPFCRKFLNFLPYSFQGLPFAIASFIFITFIAIVYSRERSKKNIVISVVVAFIAAFLIAFMFNKGALIPLP